MAKDNRITIRLSSEELDHVKKQAAAAGYPPSRLIRESATGLAIITNTDAEVLRELRRLGGLCKHAIVEGADREAAAEAFKNLGKYAASLIR